MDNYLGIVTMGPWNEISGAPLVALASASVGVSFIRVGAAWVAARTLITVLGAHIHGRASDSIGT